MAAARAPAQLIAWHRRGCSSSSAACRLYGVLRPRTILLAVAGVLSLTWRLRDEALTLPPEDTRPYRRITIAERRPAPREYAYAAPSNPDFTRGASGGGKGKGKGSAGDGFGLDLSQLSGNDMRTKDLLVRKLKSLQRREAVVRLKWTRYSDDYGGGMRDPARHDPEFIRHFLTVLQEEQASPEKAREEQLMATLVNRLNHMCEEEPLVRRSWNQWCEERGLSIRDPKVHGTRFVQAFIDEVDKGLLSDVPRVTDELHDRWEDAKMQAPSAFLWQWRHRCKEYGYDVHGGRGSAWLLEPWGQPADFVADFLEDWEAGRLYQADPPPEQMARRIEALVLSPVKTASNVTLDPMIMRQEWTSHTRRGGFSVMDPRQQPASFVRRFLERWDK